MINCFNEKVTPKSIPKFPESSHHIFPDYIMYYIESCIKNQNFEKMSNFEEAKHWVNTSVWTNACHIKLQKN